jgi:hypothetical protein
VQLDPPALKAQLAQLEAVQPAHLALSAQPAPPALKVRPG